MKAAECRKPCSALATHFADTRVRQVALDARRGVTVTALEPAVVLLVHRRGNSRTPADRGEIGEALRVHEGERADTGGDPEQADQENDEALACHDLPEARANVAIVIRATMTGPHAVSRMLPMA